MANRFSPGCQCCGCEVMSDDFADDSIDSSKWTVQSGDWSETGNELLSNTGGPGQVITTVATVANEAGIRAKVHASGSPMLILHWEDDDNHVTAEIDVTLWTTKIRRKSGGIYSTLATGSAVSGAASNDIWSFCQSTDGYYVLRNVTQEKEACFSGAEAIPSELPAGLGVVNSGTAARFGPTVYVYDANDKEDFCPVCNPCCVNCTDATCDQQPETLTVTVPAISSGTCPTPNACGDIAGGTFGLDRIASCEYRYTGPGGFGKISEIYVDLNGGFASNSSHIKYFTECGDRLEDTVTFSMPISLDCTSINEDITLSNVNDTNNCYGGEVITVQS